MRDYIAAHRYQEMRQQHPDRRARDVWAFVNNDDQTCGTTFEEFTCRHDWVVNEESDRTYCCNCGADGDA